MEEKKIWDLLLEGIGNEYGVAGLMGNLMAESTLNPLCMTGGESKKWTSGKAYADAVNKGDYSKNYFSRDNIAFGLAQWLYWSRKEALYDYAALMDIGSVEAQIGFLLKELPAYKTVWETLKTAKSVREASDIVMLKYEKPANVTDTMKERREKFGLGYYDKFSAKPDPSDSPAPEPEIRVLSKIRTTADRVLVRCGNGKNYASFGRIETKGTAYPYIATSDNGWYAIKYGKQVVWISSEFSEPVYE